MDIYAGPRSLWLYGGRLISCLVCSFVNFRSAKTLSTRKGEIAVIETVWLPCLLSHVIISDAMEYGK